VPPGLDGLEAVLSYEGGARAIVAGLKYRNARGGLASLAAAMAGRAAAASHVDLVTWVPTSAGRARERGFDQAALLARSVAARLRLPCRRLLRRHGGSPQTGRSLAERQAGPLLVGVVPVPGRAVLLVDDVVTTGSTMSAAGRALRDAGAARVFGVAAAATPRTLGLSPATRSGPWTSP
jgi:predicted amidophosphoribosyltransferase